LKIYTSLISTDDSHNLQDVLSNLLVWSKDWQLEVKVSKSHLIHLYKNNPLTDYYFDTNLIESCDLVNDIGVVSIGSDTCMSFIARLAHSVK